MDYTKTLSGLFFLLIHADGKVSPNELTRGRQMMEVEKINSINFNLSLENLKAKDRQDIYNDCIQGLKNLTIKNQLKCIAWLCVVANADGFMDKEEWKLIYKIYQTELNLKLEDIMSLQKDFNRLIHGKAFHSLGARVA